MDSTIMANKSKECLTFKTALKTGGAQTLAIEPILLPDQDMPMHIFDKTFSRYKFTICGEGKQAYFNLKMEEIPSLIKKISVFTEDFYKRSLASKTENENLNPAFTTKFLTGELKGKTVAQAIKEKGRKEIIETQYVFLSKNAEKYPANKKIMAAIEAAQKLTNEEIAAALPNANTGEIIPVLKLPYHPLVRKAREDGKVLVYEGNINYFPNNTYPFSIEIRNYYATVVKTENGMYNVQAATKADEVVKKQFLTAEDMDAIASWIDWLNQAYITIKLKSQMDLLN